MIKKEKIIAVIPARLQSKRLPNKLLMKINDTTILEHVINRLILSNSFSKIIIASPNTRIKKIVKKYKKLIFFKSKIKHFSGTSRSIEAVRNLNFSKLVVVFGDEPLIKPSEIRYFVNQILLDNKNLIWNATIKLKNFKELKNRKIVKCFLDQNKNIIDLKRYCNSNSILELKKNIHKSVGLIAFRSSILKDVINLKKNSEGIEQLNFIRDKNFSIKSIKLNYNFFSINNLNDFINAKNEFKLNKIQKNISSIYKL